MSLGHRPKPSASSRPDAEAEFSRSLQAAADAPDEANLRAAVSAGTVFLKLVPPDDHAYAYAVLNLSSIYGALSRLTPDDATLRGWDTYLRDHVTLIRPSKWRQLVAVHVLARILADLALTTGEAGDREEAITALEHARSLSWNAEVDATCAASLARLRLYRFSDLHEPADLESAINEGFEVAIGEDTSAAVRQLAVVTVIQGLRMRAEATGSKDDLTVAIYQAETLLAEMGTSRAPFRQEVRDLVAALLRRRFSYTGDLADLDRAVSIREQLLEESADDRERALHLDNLGNLYSDRYGALHERGDLEAALDASRDALRLLEEDAPERGLMLANLGLTLTMLFRESRERHDSDEAVRRFREGLTLPGLQPDVGLRLHAGLGRHLLARSVFLTEASALDDAIDELRSTLVLALAEEGRLPVTFRLGQRSHMVVVSRQLTGALLRRSRAATDSASVTEDLLEAVAVTEATKSPLLVQALLHRTQVSEPNSADGFLEGRQLSLLDALDSAELAVGETGISSDEQVGWMERRYPILEWLEELWKRYEAQSPELAARVARLRYPAMLVLDGLRSRHETQTLLAVCDLEDLDATGTFQRAQCAVLCPPGQAPPELLTVEPGDVLPEAAARLAREVVDGAGADSITETWHEALAGWFSPRTLSASQVVVVSPAPSGASIPWALVLERCGWRTDDDSPLAVFTVPSFAVLALPEPNRIWYTPLDRAELFGNTRPAAGDEQPTSLGAGLFNRVINPDEAQYAVVVGNPTLDLPFATSEAAAVADILHVTPLIGQAATIASVVGWISEGRLIHIAAHAKFEPEAPLRSHIRLSDGVLPAARLVGNSADADLVVLSACQAGSGAALVGSEVLGLVSALVRAGVGSVVASVWSVDDASTSYLMRTFHRLVADGTEPVRALAQAQTKVRTQKGWSAPYYWAGFMIAGRRVLPERG